MPRTYSEDEETIQECIHEIRHQEKPNLRQHAKNRGLPYQRLLARYHGRGTRSSRQKTNNRFTEEQEEAIHEYLRRLYEIGTSAGLWQLQHCANAILASVHNGRGPSTYGWSALGNAMAESEPTV